MEVPCVQTEHFFYELTQGSSRKGFPGGLDGRESTYNAGDPGSIPGSGRSRGEEIGYPLQYSWASLVDETVKNPPATWKTLV